MPRNVTVTQINDAKDAMMTTWTYRVPSFPLPLPVWSFLGQAQLIKRADDLKNGRIVTQYHRDRTMKKKYKESPKGIRNGSYRQRSRYMNIDANYADDKLDGCRTVNTRRFEQDGSVTCTDHKQFWARGGKVGRWTTKQARELKEEMIFHDDMPDMGIGIKYDNKQNPVDYYVICGQHKIERIGYNQYRASVLDIPGGTEVQNLKKDGVFTPERMAVLFESSERFLNKVIEEEPKKAAQTVVDDFDRKNHDKVKHLDENDPVRHALVAQFSEQKKTVCLPQMQAEAAAVKARYESVGAFAFPSRATPRPSPVAVP